MARGRGQESGDSLDLLLDAICNVFGGIILMAILVVMQTQAAADRLPVVEKPEEESLKVSELRFELGRLQRSILEEGGKLNELRKRIGEQSTPVTAKLLSRREQFVEAIEKAERALQELNSRSAKAASASVEARQRRSDLTRAAEALLAEKVRLEQTKATRIKATMIRGRLPRWHRSSATEQRCYVVAGAKAYRIGDNFSYGAPRPYLCGECKVTPMLGVQANFVEPVPDLGTEVGKPDARHDGFRRVLTQDSSSTYYISFFVRADSESFATFQRARAMTVAEGYEYSVGAYGGRGLVLSPGAPPTE